MSLSNGPSFSNGPSMSISSVINRSMESWTFRLLRPVQDRGPL